MASSQETERVYSYNPGTRTGPVTARTANCLHQDPVGSPSLTYCYPVCARLTAQLTVSKHHEACKQDCVVCSAMQNLHTNANRTGFRSRVIMGIQQRHLFSKRKSQLLLLGAYLWHWFRVEMNRMCKPFHQLCLSKHLECSISKTNENKVHTNRATTT